MFRRAEQDRNSAQPSVSAHETRRLRVLLLIDHLSDSGGAERFALGLATHLPRDRLEVSMCATRTAEPAAEAILDAARVPYRVLGRRGKADAWRLAGLVGLLRSERIDVLHAHKFGSNAWGSLIGAGCRVPVIVAEEHTWSYEGGSLRKLVDRRVIGRLATRFVAVSYQDARRMVEIEHVPADKVLMIPSAYVPRPSADTDVRAEIGISSETPLVAVVAVLRAQKALDVLLDAMPRVLEHQPEAHLVIAGDGPCKADLRAQASRLGLAERVHFLGRRRDPEAILRAAQLAVISSDYEGTPLVAYECFANGTPLVSTAVGGLVDLVADGVTGRLVPPRDPPALAAAIAELLGDSELRVRLARAAADGPGARIDAIALRFADLYEALAAARAGHRP